MSKKYQKKSASKAKRSKKTSGQQYSGELGETHGVMGGMVHGFRRAVGSGGAEQSKGSSVFWTAALVALALALVVWVLAR